MMKVPTEFPQGSRFWATFSGDEIVEFPDGTLYKLSDCGETLNSINALPRTGAAPISEQSFQICAADARAFAASQKTRIYGGVNPIES